MAFITNVDEFQTLLNACSSTREWEMLTESILIPEQIPMVNSDGVLLDSLVEIERKMEERGGGGGREAEEEGGKRRRRETRRRGRRKTRETIQLRRRTEEEEGGREEEKEKEEEEGE